MENRRVIDIFGFDVKDSTLYFSAKHVNGIFCMDVPTGKIEYVTMPEKNFYNGLLYQDAKIDKNKIWFSPYGADNILIYNLVLDSCEYIDVPKLEGHGRQAVKFYALYDYDEWFILLPVEYPAILKIKKATYEIRIVPWEEKLLKKYPDFLDVNKGLSIARDFEVVDENMYLLAENVVIKYDMKTDELSFIQISHEARLYSGIVKYRDGFALVDRINSEFVVWNGEGSKIEKSSIDLGYRGIGEGDDGCPLGLFRVSKGIVIVQANADFLLIVDESGATRKINLNIKKNKAEDFFFTRVKQKGSKLIFPLDGQNIVLMVDTDDWSQQCIEMNLIDADFSWLMEKKGKEGKYILENTVYYDMVDFINYIKKNEKYEDIKAKEHNIGTCIFRSI